MTHITSPHPTIHTHTHLSTYLNRGGVPGGAEGAARGGRHPRADGQTGVYMYVCVVCAREGEGGGVGCMIVEAVLRIATNP